MWRECTIKGLSAMFLWRYESSLVWYSIRGHTLTKTNFSPADSMCGSPGEQAAAEAWAQEEEPEQEEDADETEEAELQMLEFRARALKSLVLARERQMKQKAAQPKWTVSQPWCTGEELAMKSSRLLTVVERVDTGTWWLDILIYKASCLKPAGFIYLWY